MSDLKSPKITELHKNISNLKEDLAYNIFLKYDLEYSREYFEVKFLTKFGILEYELYKLDLEILKAEKKNKLVKIKVDYNEIIDFSSINKQLDEEFEEDEKLIEGDLNNLNNIKERENNLNIVSKEEYDEIKSIFLKIIEEIHPDINKSFTRENFDILDEAADAFKNKDLNELKSINLLIAMNTNNPNDSDDIDELNEEYVKLNNLIIDIRMENKQTQENFPFNKKSLIFNEKKGAEYKKLLNECINDKTIELAKNKNILKKLLEK